MAILLQIKTDQLIKSCLYIAHTPNMGRGVFTSAQLASNIIIEISPVIVMSHEERKLLDQTLLHDYIFEWGSDQHQCCMALGYIAVYNHSYQSNCEYQMDFDERLITIKTVRDIPVGEELFINYNGNWNDEKRVWFDE
jgi:SET domain-containing protein